MTRPSPEHPLAVAERRLRARKIAFLRSAPDPDNPRSTEEDMVRLFGGLPETESGQS
jgi:hypothetical protein